MSIGRDVKRGATVSRINRPRLPSRLEGGKGEAPQEVEVALADADAAASDARERAFDLIAAPDAAAARETMQTAEFTAARLRTALPKLKQKLTAAVAKR